MTTPLHNQIMRRIYYAYVIRTVGDPTVLKGFLMLALMIVLSYFVSLGNVLYNLSHQPLVNLPQSFYNAVTNTEAWTLLILGILIMTALSLPFRRLMLWPAARYSRV